MYVLQALAMYLFEREYSSFPIYLSHPDAQGTLKPSPQCLRALLRLCNFMHIVSRF